MRRIKLIAIIGALIALIVPLQAVAQQAYYMDVTGTVYNQAFKVQGAKVLLYTYNFQNGMPGDVVSTTTSNSQGGFTFRTVVFDPSKPFQYAVKADREGNAAWALVAFLPPEPNTTDSSAVIMPINLDISSPSMKSDITVTVWSTEGKTTATSNLAPVSGAKLTLYKVEPGSHGNRTQLSSSEQVLTDYAGQHTYVGLPYGIYAVRAEKNGFFGEQTFYSYQQLTPVQVKTNIPLPSPTPTPKPGTGTATPTPSPGFEGIAALIGLLGVALYLRRAK